MYKGTTNISILITNKHLFYTPNSGSAHIYLILVLVLLVIPPTQCYEVLRQLDDVIEYQGEEFAHCGCEGADTRNHRP